MLDLSHFGKKICLFFIILLFEAFWADLFCELEKPESKYAIKYFFSNCPKFWENHKSGTRIFPDMWFSQNVHTRLVLIFSRKKSTHQQVRFTSKCEKPWFGANFDPFSTISGEKDFSRTCPFRWKVTNIDL